MNMISPGMSRMTRRPMFCQTILWSTPAAFPPGAAPAQYVCPTRACYNANYDQIMPRVGFAYQAMDKLVIRGGYGATSFFEGFSFNQRLTSSPPFSLAINSNATTPSAGSGGTPFTVANAFSQPLGINNSLVFGLAAEYAARLHPPVHPGH